MGEQLKIGLLYLGLHNQLIKKFGENQIITRRQFQTKLGKHYMIPKSLRHYVITEMQKMGLVSLINRDTIKILYCEIDLTKDAHKFLQQSGFKYEKEFNY